MRAQDYAGQSRKVRDRSVFRAQMQLWSCNIFQEPYNSTESDMKKEIPSKGSEHCSLSMLSHICAPQSSSEFDGVTGVFALC